MKRLLPCLLALLLLSGCGFSVPFLPGREAVTQEQNEAETPSDVPVVTEQPAPVTTPEPVVIYDAMLNEGVYTDSLGNTWNYVFRIPAIQAAGSDATKLNQELFMALYPAVKDAQDAMAEGLSLGINGVDYQVFVKDQMVSIVAEIDTDWGFEEYHVANFDAASLSACSREQLLQKLGVTEEEFLHRAQNTVESYFEKSFSGIAKDSMYQDRHDKSVDPENFKSDCQLFINDEGALCMIVKIYSMAGADYYYHLMPVL